MVIAAGPGRADPRAQGASRVSAASGAGEERRIAAVVEAWVTGRRHPVHRSIVFAEVLDERASELVAADPSAALIAPTGSTGAPGTAVVEYDGRFTEIGDETTVAGRTLELQDYAASAFLDVVGPMVVRLGDEGGWAALLDDADRAVEEGLFPAHLLNPSVLLAERGAFLAEAGGWSRDPRPVVTGSRGVRWAPEGPSVETEAASPLVQAFGGVVDPERILADSRARPWLGRYIAATELLRRTGRGPRAQILGLGVSLLDDSADDRGVPVDSPFLSRDEEGWLLEDLATRRRFRLSTEAATIVEALQTSSTRERAVERCASALGLSAAEAAARTEQVAAGLAKAGTPTLEKDER